MKHPTLLTPQERLRIADDLRRIAQDPTDTFDPATLEQASRIIYMQEARLVSVAAAIKTEVGCP